MDTISNISEVHLKERLLDTPLARLARSHATLIALLPPFPPRSLARPFLLLALHRQALEITTAPHHSSSDSMKQSTLHASTRTNKHIFSFHNLKRSRQRPFIPALLQELLRK